MSLEDLQSQEQELTVEDRARQLGWHPKEEFKGDPERWVDADTFMKKGEEELPVLRSNLKKIQAELAKEREEFQKTAKEFREWHETTVQKAEREAYEKARAEIEQKKLDAVELGDKEAYLKAQEAEKALETKKAPQPQQQQASVDPVFEDWRTKNAWYEEYPELAVEADNVGFALWNSGKFKNTGQVYEEVAKSIRRKYPHYFQNPNRDVPPPVNEGGEPASGRRSKARSFENLPASAKEACDKFIRMGMIKSREDYLKSYDWGN